MGWLRGPVRSASRYRRTVTIAGVIALSPAPSTGIRFDAPASRAAKLDRLRRTIRVTGIGVGIGDWRKSDPRSRSPSQLGRLPFAVDLKNATWADISPSTLVLNRPVSLRCELIASVAIESDRGSRNARHDRVHRDTADPVRSRKNLPWSAEIFPPAQSRCSREATLSSAFRDRISRR